MSFTDLKQLAITYSQPQQADGCSSCTSGREADCYSLLSTLSEIPKVKKFRRSCKTHQLWLRGHPTAGQAGSSMWLTCQLEVD